MLSKTILVVLAVAAMVAGLSGAASAALDNKWVVQLRVTDLNNDNGLPTVQFGTAVSASYAGQGPNDGSDVEVYSQGTNRYSKEIRAAQPANVTMTWDLRVAAGSNYVGARFRLHAWNVLTSDYDLDPNWTTDPANAFRVRIYKGTSLEYTFDPTLNGSITAPQWSKEYDILPGQTLTDFKLVREPVPEPAGLLALLGGLAGLRARRRGKK